MNDKEKKLIVELRKNSRQRINKIATLHNFPVSTMADILKRLQKKKLFHHTTKIKFEKLGFPLNIKIALKTILQERPSLEEYLQKSPNLNNLYKINDGYDYMAELVFRNHGYFQDFLEDLELKNTIIQKQVFHITRTIQEEKFLTSHEHFK